MNRRMPNGTYGGVRGERKSPLLDPQEIIDHALQPGPPFEHGKYRIYSYFLQGHSNKERAEFLKQEYGMGGSLSDYLGERFYLNEKPNPPAVLGRME